MIPHSHLRPAEYEDAAAIAAVQVASWQATYPGLLPDAMIAMMNVPDRTASWQRIIRSLSNTGSGGVFVVTEQDRLIGFASYGKQREPELLSQGYTGEVSAIYLMPDVLRQGIGAMLMAASGRALARAGHKAASVWVLTANSAAVQFYKALGGVQVGEKAGASADSVHETAYGWPDIGVLAGTATPRP